MLTVQLKTEPIKGPSTIQPLHNIGVHTVLDEGVQQSKGPINIYDIMYPTKRSMRTTQGAYKTAQSGLLKSPGFQALDTQASKEYFSEANLIYIKKIHFGVAHYGILVRKGCTFIQLLMTTQPNICPPAKLITAPTGDYLITLEQASTIKDSSLYTITDRRAKYLKTKFNYSLKSGTYDTEGLAEQQTQFDAYMRSINMVPTPIFIQY